MEVASNIGYQQGQQVQTPQNMQQYVATESANNVRQVEEKSEIDKIQEDVAKEVGSQEKMEALVEQLNDALSPFNTSLKFGFDSKSEDFYVSIIESKTNKLIRRFPAEEAADMLPKMKEFSGMLFDQKG
jgi:flagellar protein FlaG